MSISNQKTAGIILFIGSVGFLLAENVAEFLYPDYSVSQNYISDLGATCNATCRIVQPTSTIFNSSVFLVGVAIVLGSYFLYRTFGRLIFSGLLILSGIGAIGVGIFPETFPVEHGIFSLVVFLFGGLAAIAAYNLPSKPFNYFSVALGILTVIALVFYVPGIYLGLGAGGMERLVAYPVLFWGIGLGAYMMGAPEQTKVSKAVSASASSE